MNSEALKDPGPEIDDQRDESVAILSALETKRPRRRWPWALVALAIASVLLIEQRELRRRARRTALAEAIPQGAAGA